MRGTCSPGFVIRGAIAPEQCLHDPFSTVMAESIVPVTHSSGRTSGSESRPTPSIGPARSCGRPHAHAGETPPTAVRLSHLMSELSLLRAEVGSALDTFMRARGRGRPGRAVSTMATVLRFNNLKIAASEQAAEVCQGALAVCGIMGYKNNTPYSVGRHLRDSLSASLMIANERIHNTNAGLLLIAKDV